MKTSLLLLRSCLVPLGVLAVAPAASAATMTFGLGQYFDTIGDPYGFDDLYLEDGISVTGFILGALTDSRAAAHLDNPADGHFTDHLEFSLAGRFNLHRFDILPLGFECLSETCPGYDNVIVTGFREGAIVARTMFSMGFQPSVFYGGSAFTNLDRLMVSTHDGPEDYWFGNTHFEIDNVVLNAVDQAPAPVPLPASLPLLVLGLSAMGLIARRRPAT